MELSQVFNDMVEKSESWDLNVTQLFQFCHHCCTGLVSTGASESALRLFLHSALAMDNIDFKKRESMAYEFISQVCVDI